MKRAFALLASPALAQDDRVVSASQIAKGIAACLGSKADQLGKTGRTNVSDACGTLIFTPSTADNTLVMRPSDATRCRVERMDLNTVTAAP